MSNSPSKTSERHPRATLVAVVALVTATLPLVGGQAEASATSNTALTIAVQNVPATLNPAKTDNGGNNVTFAQLAYDSLIYLAPNGSYQPDLALSWGYVGQGNEQFVLQLRHNVRFSDGTTMTAQDVANSIEYAYKSGSTATQFLADFKSATATGQYTVDLRFSAPRPDLPTVFEQNSLSGDIIGPVLLGKPNSLGTATDGTGPYMLDAAKTVTGSSYVYVPNPDYWNTSQERYASVTVNVISDPTAELNAVRTGQDDFMFGGGYPQVGTAISSGLKVYAAPNGWTALFIEDYTGTLVKALGSEEVRQAIGYATDRPVLAKALYSSYAFVTDETESPGTEGYNPAYNNYYAYNPAKAKQLLAEAGYKDGFTMTIVSTPVLNIETETEAIASELSQVGITVKIHEDATFTEAVNDWLSRKYPAFVGTYGTLPMSIMAPTLFPTTAIFNPFHNPQPTILSLINKADTLDGAAAERLYEQAEADSVVGGYYDVMFYSDDIYFARPGVIANLEIGNNYPGSDFAPDAGFWAPSH